MLDTDAADKYGRGDGPEYVTLGKFGPNLGIDRIEPVIRLNNICNDLGLDTASTGLGDRVGDGAVPARHHHRRRHRRPRSDMGQRRIGRAAAVHDGARAKASATCSPTAPRAVETRHYPAEALEYRMAVKGLMQSDPHDARILKAFALGLAVATRGMDHLRNRVTLEINARINDDPAFKARLYGGPVSAAPNSYDDKERAVRVCENIYARRRLPSACAGSRRSCSTARRCRGSRSSPRRSATSPGLELTRGGARSHRSEHHGRRAADQSQARRHAAPTTRCPIAGSTSRSASARTQASRSIAPSSTRCCHGSTRSRISTRKASRNASGGASSKRCWRRRRDHRALAVDAARQRSRHARSARAGDDDRAADRRPRSRGFPGSAISSMTRCSTLR